MKKNNLSQHAIAPMLPSGLFCQPDEIARLRRPAVAIGNFDGIHRGHQQIFQQLTEYAAAHHIDAAALSFLPHPIAFFQPQSSPFLLQTESEKKTTALGYGVSLLPLRFEVIVSMSPQEFVTQVLVDSLDASCVMVGKNFRFGKNRSGDVGILRHLCQEASIECVVVEDVLHEPTEPQNDLHLVSSTKIRRALVEGRLRDVTQLIGRPWEINGRVVHGDAIGKTLGFPTANIEFDANRLLPPAGIYASRLVLGETSYGAASYIGNRPTFTANTPIAKEMRIEAYVIDAPDPFVIYDEWVRLQFIDFVRADQSFESPEALVHEMERDVRAIRKILG